MRKEQIIAIFLGSLIGIGVAFFIWRINRNIVTQKETFIKEERIEATETTSPLGFGVVSPQNNSVSQRETIDISGFGISNSVVAALGNTLSVSTVNDGEFALKYSLAPGINKIVIWSIDGEKAPTSMELTVTYSESLGLSAGQPVSAAAGAITDIAADALQIRTEDGQIAQVSLSTETTFRSIRKTPADISFSDLAIGDFVVALGTINSNDVIEVLEVLVSTEPTLAKKEIIAGSIKTLSNREFIVSSHSGEEVSIDATGRVLTETLKEGVFEKARLGNSSEGQKIIIFGERKGEELVAERIILL